MGIENFINKIQERIEKNSYKQFLTSVRKKRIKNKYENLSIEDLNENRSSLKLKDDDKVISIEEDKQRYAIIERTELVYLKRSYLPFIGDWTRIYPVVKDLSKEELVIVGKKWWKKVNWINLIIGGVKNLYKFLFIMICLLGLYLFVRSAIGSGIEYLNGNKYVILTKEIFLDYCKTGTRITYG